MIKIGINIPNLSTNSWCDKRHVGITFHRVTNVALVSWNCATRN